MKNVKIGDVAREAGVSLGTVSNALNHPDKVRPETLAIVNEAIERMGYVPNQGARQLAGGKSHTFGLVLPRLDHAFSLQIANGAQSEARAHGYDLVIASAGNDDILENHYMNYFAGMKMAGVLVQPMAGASWKPQQQAALVPTVYLDVHGTVSGVYVAADNEMQGRLMLSHAVECGAKTVAVIGKAEFVQMSLRVRGVCDEARKTGVSVELIGEGDWNRAEDGFSLGRMLASRPKAHRPDFVLGLTDVLAAGAIDGIRSASLEVPDDMLVAGCDGNPLAWSGHVPLTTITSPGFSMGQRGVQLLLDRIGGEKLGAFHQDIVESKLVMRLSTATSRKERKSADIPDLNLGEYL